VFSIRSRLLSASNAALLIGGLLELFGLNLYMIRYLPGALCELTLPIWLILKGFNSSAAIVSESAQAEIDERDRVSLSKT
jgi:hypothetical protein